VIGFLEGFHFLITGDVEIVKKHSIALPDDSKEELALDEVDVQDGAESLILDEYLDAQPPGERSPD
jgi:hypothetical protein